jgi:hypothetical protein
VLNSLAAREQKAGRYERLLPWKRVAGRPLNEAFYLPERRGEVRTQPVPEQDRARVRRVLEAPARRAEKAPPVLEIASREEIDRFWEGRSLGDSAYRARLAVVGDAATMIAAVVTALDVRVENLSDAVWPWGPASQPEIRVSYRWWSATRLVSEGLRTALPEDLPSGGAALVPVAVQAPAAPGRYRLAIDLVHEHVRWFGAEVSLEVEVAARRRLAVFAPVPLERLAELEPPLEPLLLVAEPEALSGVYAGEVAPSAEPYLLAGLPAGRAAVPLLAWRTARLLWSARRREPRFGTAFLQALASAEALYVRGGGSSRRERWVRWATVRAARSRGLRVVE